MGDKIIDGSIEWIKDVDTGEVSGYKLKNGTERGIANVITNPLTGNITRIMPVTQAQYDALSPVDAETLYVIVEAA